MALTKSFQFNPPTNLKEALGAFLVLLIIGAINLGQQWEERRFSVQHFTAEIQCMLKLNESQAQQLEKINYDFYDKASKAYASSLFDESRYCTEMQVLCAKREASLMKVLNDKQKNAWKSLVVYAECKR